MSDAQLPRPRRFQVRIHLLGFQAEAPLIVTALAVIGLALIVAGVITNQWAILGVGIGNVIGSLASGLKTSERRPEAPAPVPPLSPAPPAPPQ